MSHKKTFTQWLGKFPQQTQQAIQNLKEWDCRNCNAFFDHNPGPHCPECKSHNSIYPTQISSDETEN